MKPVNVTDLLHRAGRERAVSGVFTLRVRVGEAEVVGPVEVEAELVGSGEGVTVDMTAAVPVHLTCSRCLTGWDEQIPVSGRRLFTTVADEDGYRISPDARLDLGPWIRDEVSLALPDDPLCRPDCRGLCAVCGADLNVETCEGHDEMADSPFAVLETLLDSTD